MPLDPARTVVELKELRGLTGNEDGAQRVAWTDTWETARIWLREKLAGTGVTEQIDAAGNQWFTLAGESSRAVLMNALSLSAVFGILVLIFQHGSLQGCSRTGARARSMRRNRS